MVSDFATAEAHIAESYTFVMDSTDVPMDLREALLPIWIYAHQSGNPKIEPPALAILGEFKWTWKPFEDWLETFKKAGRWPYMWEKFDIPDLVKRDSQWKLRQARVRLLAHTLSMSAYKCRDGHKDHSLHRSRGWHIPSIKCPVEDEVAAALLNSIDLDDWRTWPPFFPGDRSSLHVKPRTPR
jgi:hypothetical protein